MKTLQYLTFLSAASFLFVSNAFASEGFDSAKYTELAKGVIAKLIAGEKDVDAQLKELISLGKAGVQAHASNAATTENEKKYMELVAKNADSMSSLSLEEIEAKWHDGEMGTSNGVNMEAIEHFGATNSLADTVIHPATAIIAIKDGDLDQAKGELEEVLEHLKHIN